MEKNSIHQLAKILGAQLSALHYTCVVAESCTGGGLAAAITEIPGSSVWFDRGFVTYSNAAKEQMLAVPRHIIANYGSVSEQTVCAMAEGALCASNAQISVAISGIAGPSGGSAEKPVGTVWLAWSTSWGATKAARYFFTGTRRQIRKQCIEAALEGLIRVLKTNEREIVP